MRCLVFVVIGAMGCLHDDAVPQRAIVGGAPVSPAARAADGDTVVGPVHLSRGYPARNADGTVNAVVEIPCGTTAKFEVHDDGVLRWKRKREDNSRREIDYLPYPVNYGMVPNTLADDGDALDVFVLGRGIERAHVAQTRVIGVLKMAQDGVRDDKLVAVTIEPALRNGFSDLEELEELDQRYPASRDILALWFAHYWGKGATTVVGWGNAAEATAILEQAIERVRPHDLAYTARLDPAGPRPRAALPFCVLAR